MWKSSLELTLGLQHSLKKQEYMYFFSLNNHFETHRGSGQIHIALRGSKVFKGPTKSSDLNTLSFPYITGIWEWISADNQGCLYFMQKLPAISRIFLIKQCELFLSTSSGKHFRVTHSNRTDQNKSCLSVPLICMRHPTNMGWKTVIDCHWWGEMGRSFSSWLYNM